MWLSFSSKFFIVNVQNMSLNVALHKNSYFASISYNNVHDVSSSKLWIEMKQTKQMIVCECICNLSFWSFYCYSPLFYLLHGLCAMTTPKTNLRVKWLLVVWSYLEVFYKLTMWIFCVIKRSYFELRQKSFFKKFKECIIRKAS